MRGAERHAENQSSIPVRARRVRGRARLSSPAKETAVYLDDLVDDLTRRLDLFKATGIERPASRYAGEAAAPEHVTRLGTRPDARIVPW